MRMRSKTVKTVIVSAVLALGGGALWLLGQEAKNPVFRTKVDLVVLSFTVTDNKGHYINNLSRVSFAFWKTASWRKSPLSLKATNPRCR